MEIFTFIMISIVSRLVPHIPNVTAVGAATLFTSAKFGIKKSVIVLLCTMLISDILLGLHQVMWATYGSLILSIYIGQLVKKSYSYKNIIFGALMSSVAFFIITNFAVWMIPNGMYEKTIYGLVRCYVMALPFFRNTIFGDVLYTTFFFIGFEFIKASKISLKKIFYVLYL